MLHPTYTVTSRIGSPLQENRKPVKTITSKTTFILSHPSHTRSLIKRLRPSDLVLGPLTYLRPCCALGIILYTDTAVLLDAVLFYFTFRFRPFKLHSCILPVAVLLWLVLFGFCTARNADRYCNKTKSYPGGLDRN